MSGPATRANAPLGNMEGDVLDVVRWGRLLIHVSVEGQLPDKESMCVIGQAVEALGERLEKRWHEAVEADRERRLQCA